jgi:glc operon protein GlcG
MTLSVKKIACTVCLALQSLWSFPALALDSTVNVKVISEAGAQRALMAAEQEAEKLHAPCAIAVVDSSGILVAFLKMDGVRAGSPDLAIGKARTSALLQRPSAETEDNVDKGRVSFITSGLMTLRGGVPLLAGKDVVGAIGIAGLNKDNDVAIAQAAAAAFASLSESQPPSH